MKLTEFITTLIVLQGKLGAEQSEVPIYFDSGDGDIYPIDVVKFESHFISLSGD